MTATHDFAALTAAIDAGDDSALPALADLLEEEGDPRAAGLRKILHPSSATYSPCRVSTDGQTYRWGWELGRNAVWSIGELMAMQLDRLTAPSRFTNWRLYPTCSAAYLALAEALAAG